MSLDKNKSLDPPDSGGKAKPPRKPEDNVAFSVGVWVLLAFGLVITASVLFAGYHNVEKFKELGSWGDFVGGLLNPILTFLTFMAVLLTLWLQRAELRLTRDELIRSADAMEDQGTILHRQSFESTFFAMLRSHNSIVEAIDLVNTNTGVVTKGRDAFTVFYSRFAKIYKKTEAQFKETYDPRKIVEVSYFIFWKDAQTELSHYFRFLFNFFRFIEKSEYENEHYVKLLRSQISDQELLLLFYNNVSKNGQPFGYYASRYALFDNMPVVRLLKESHSELADKKSYGDNSMDFKPYVP